MQKLALVFRENPFSLNELIGYADLTVFHEIWSEYSLLDREQKACRQNPLLLGYANSRQSHLTELQKDSKRNSKIQNTT